MKRSICVFLALFFISGTSYAHGPFRIGGIALNSLPQSLLPAVDDTYDLGSSSKEFKDLYVDGVAYIDEFEDYTRHIDIYAGSANVGNTAPTPTTVGTTARGLGFNNANELAYFNWEVPTDWNGSSDFEIEIIWVTQAGDAIQNTEDVDWDIQYHSVAEGEAIDNGSVATATATYLAGATQTDKEMFETEIDIPYNTGNQPLTAGDTVTMLFIRNTATEANSYTGEAVVLRWEIKYTANKMPYQ